MTAIQRAELMNNEQLINWLGVLGNGYVKPDHQNGSGNQTGVVRETKHYMPFIMLINKELCERAGLECPDVGVFTNFRNNRD